jgi:hypothetical protein
MILEGFTINMGKLAFVLIFVALANPIGSHALARAAMESGLKPLLFRKEEWDGASVIADSVADSSVDSSADSKKPSKGKKSKQTPSGGSA